MFIYTTCRDCGGSLLATKDETVHPGCTPKPTKLERLSTKWLEAIENFEQLEADLIEEQINELNNRPPRLRDAALAYAKWGWPVFPLKPLSQVPEIAEKTGQPFDKVAKRPATKNGFKDATTDTTRIEAWWKRHPDSNIGLATGIKFDVIDIDPRHGGAESYVQLRSEEDERTGRGPIPDCHGQVATASGGWHLYVLPTGNGNTTNIRPGIDYRGIGGYVVAPPSTLGEPGRDWSWITYPSPVVKAGADVND